MSITSLEGDYSLNNLSIRSNLVANKVTSTYLDAAVINAGFVNGIDDIMPNVVTTEGDLVIGNSVGNPERLAIGTDGQVLTSTGTTATWSPSPFNLVLLAKWTGVTVTNGVPLTLSSANVTTGETYVADSITTDTNDSYILPAGTYLISAQSGGSATVSVTLNLDTVAQTGIQTVRVVSGSSIALYAVADETVTGDRNFLISVAKLA